MRNLAVVHLQVLAAIPDEALREELDECCRPTLMSFAYCAPEMMPALWHGWAADLEYVLGTDVAARPWLADVQRIVRGG